MYLSRLVNGYPNSQFRKQAEVDLQSLGGLIAPSETPQ
jgi:hypothetical protein